MESLAEIRAARLDDIEPVRALLSRSFDLTYAPVIGTAAAEALHVRWHAPEVLARQTAEPRSSFLVASEGDGRIVAHAFGSMTPSGVLSVVRLYVASSFQGRGLGTRLLVELADRHPGSNGARLHVLSGSVAALTFYRARGFEAVGESQEDGVSWLRFQRG